MTDFLNRGVMFIAAVSPWAFTLVSIFVTIASVWLANRARKAQELEVEALKKARALPGDQMFEVHIPANLEGKTISSTLGTLVENLANSDVTFTVSVSSPEKKEKSE